MRIQLLLLLLLFTNLSLANSVVATPLSSEQAFKLTISQKSVNQLRLQWHIAPGYYLYREHLHFATMPPGLLVPPYLPKSSVHADLSLGKVQIYSHNLAIDLVLTHRPTNQAVTLTIEYQGCATFGLCYPPITKHITLQPLLATVPANTGNSIAHLMLQKQLAWTLAAFYGFGLLLAFTPCVLPMIPIISSLILGQQCLSTRRSFILSLYYVLAMATTYAGLGIMAGFAGNYLQAYFQNTWLIVGFSGLFVLLALALFGVYELRLPKCLEQKLTHANQKQMGGTYLSVISMGILSALIVSPCISAPLVGALVYISQTGDAYLGGMALWILGLGMGTPLIIIATLESRYLPKTGAWMHLVKVSFGLLLLVVAIDLLSRVFNSRIILCLYAALSLGTGIYLALLKMRSRKKRIIGKILSGIFLSYALLLLVGAIQGQQTLWPPIALDLQNQEINLPFKAIKGITGLNQALAQAKRQNKAVMLDFYADWCTACKIMERTSFAAPEVKILLQDIMLLRADITANDTQDQLLQQRLQVFAAPNILFFNAHGEEMTKQRIIGEIDGHSFIQHLEQLLPLLVLTGRDPR